VTAANMAVGSNLGISQSGVTNLVVGATSNTSKLYFGQDTNRNLVIEWTYNATPEDASARMTTWGYASDFFIDAKVLSLQTKNSSGQVGIGTDDPQAKLDVRGNIRVGDWTSADVSIFGAPASGGDFNIGQTSGAGKIKFVNNASVDLVTIQNDGDMGIGKVPTEKLDVNGTAKAITFSGDLNGTVNTATTGTTQTAGDNSTKMATTAYVDTAVSAEDIWDRTGTTISAKNTGDSLSVSSSATTTRALAIEANSLTSGEGLYVGSTSTGLNDKLVEIAISDAGASGVALAIDNNGSGPALDVESENTTLNGLDLDCDSLTTGSAAKFKSNSASTGIRNLVNIHNDNPSATGTTALNIQQDSTGLALNTNGDINVEGATANTGLFQPVYTDDAGLILNLPFKEIGSTTQYDRSSYANNCTIVGTAAVTATSGLIGSGISYQSTLGYVDIPDLASGTFDDGITMEVWSYPTATNSFAPVYTIGNGASGNNIWIERWGQNTALRVNVQDGLTQLDGIDTGFGTYPINEWTHIVVTITKAGGVKIYINGKEEGSGTVEGINAIARTVNYLGYRDGLGAAQYYNGNFARAKVYKRVLNPIEAKTSYLRGHSEDSNSVITSDEFKIFNTSGVANLTVASKDVGDDILTIKDDTQTYGALLALDSDSNNGANRSLLEIKHAGTGGATSGIDINLGASNGSILNGYTSNTTLPGLRVDCDSLTYGAVAHFASNSANTNIRKLVHIQNANAASTGTTGLVIDQASTGKAISTNGNITAGSYDGVLNDGVTATTQTVGDNSTKVATTAYADAKPTIYSANGELASTRAIIGENGKTLTFEMFNPTEDTYTTKTAIIQLTDQIDILQVTGNGAGDEGAYLGIRLGQGATNKFELIDEKYSKGAVYNADYSTNFTDRSIVDKAYVDNSITGLNPSGTHDILIAADLEALATSSIITVTTGTTLTLNIKGAISSDTRYVVESGGRLNLNYALSGSYTYTETGAQDQFTSTNGSIFLRNGSMTATGTLSTLFNNTYNSPFQVLNIVGTIFTGYHGGSLSGWGSLTFDGSPIIDYRDSITVSGQAGIKCINVSGYSFSVFPNKPAFDIKRGYGGTSVNVFSLGSWSLYGGSFIRLSPGMGDNSKNLISGLVMNLGDLFDTTGTDGTFTAVADASFSTVTIDDVSNVGGNARFNCTIVHSFSVGQEVTISGFLTYTAYNKTSIVTATDGSTYFDIDSTPYIGSENGTGSFGSSTVTLTDTGTSLSNGDSITLDSMDQNYRGGTHVYNKQTNSFQVNKTWNATATGTWSTKGLSQDDVRVIASGNPTIVDSHYYACGYVNGNTSTTTISASGTYYDIDFGTLTECPQTERWKIIDAQYGVFEYIGNEPFHGTVKYDYSAVSSGSAQNFLFKWQKDTGSGYVDIAGAIALNQLAGTAGSTGRSVSIQAVKGDLFKCKVTRTSGSGNLTVSYAGIIID
ncbi:MAG: LamG domain-containing protein, partial [Alteromonadales bacterium]|nr:LamG domain-containing protein [Alteromonadales bacterium]